MLDRVVHDVDDDALDQSCVHGGHERGVVQMDGDVMFHGPAIQLCDRALEKIFDQLRTHFEGFLICLQMGGCQQVFCHVDQPVCVVIDRQVQPFPDGRVQRGLLLHQHIGTAADVGERRAQIMGDGAEQVGLQPLLLGLQRRPVSLLLQPDALLAEAAFTQYGDHQVFFKGVRDGVACDGDSHDPHHALRPSDGEEQPFGVRQCVRGRARVLVVPLYPLGHADLLGAQSPQDLLFVGWLHPKCQLLLRSAQGIENGTAEKPVELFRSQPKAIPFSPPLLQLLTAPQKQFRIIALLRRQTGLRLDPAGQRAGDHTGEQHDQKGDWITGVVGLEGKAGFGEKKIEGGDAEERSQRAVEVAVCPNGGDQNAQNINRYDVRFAEPGIIEGKARKGGEQ